MTTYVNVPYNEIVIDEPPDEALVLYDAITIYLPDVIMRRALVLKPFVGVVQISDNDVGTGLKPVVFLNGNPVHRVNNEGTPIVMTENGYKTLSDDEELII